MKHAMIFLKKISDSTKNAIRYMVQANRLFYFTIYN